MLYFDYNFHFIISFLKQLDAEEKKIKENILIEEFNKRI